MKIKIIKSICFIFILFMLLLLLSAIVHPKNNSVEAGIHSRGASGLLAEPEDTIDVIVVGNSEAYTSIIPMELWNDYGFTSYVCASPDQSLPQSVRFVYEACRTQNPKIIMLESNNILASYELADGMDQFLDYNLKVFQYHDRWKTLNGDDFKLKRDYNTINNMKGYEYSEDVAGVDNIDNNEGNLNDVGAIPKSNIIYLQLINNYCKNHGIKFVIVSTPCEKYWSYSTYNAINNFCDANDIEFLDMNINREEINIDWTKDTRDDGNHLNHTGAIKTTKFLGKYLSNLNILKSHKDDEIYKEWNNSYEEYKKTANR